MATPMDNSEPVSDIICDSFAGSSDIPPPLILPPSILTCNDAMSKSHVATRSTAALPPPPVPQISCGFSSAVLDIVPRSTPATMSTCSPSCSPSPPSTAPPTSERGLEPGEGEGQRPVYEEKRVRVGLSHLLRHSVVLALHTMNNGQRGAPSGDVQLLRRVLQARPVHRMRKPMRVARQLVLLARDVRRTLASVLERLIVLAEEGDRVQLGQCDSVDDLCVGCRGDASRERRLWLVLVCADAGDWAGIRTLPRILLRSVALGIERELGAALEQDDGNPWHEKEDKRDVHEEKPDDNDTDQGGFTVPDSASEGADLRSSSVSSSSGQTMRELSSTTDEGAGLRSSSVTSSSGQTMRESSSTADEGADLRSSTVTSSSEQTMRDLSSANDVDCIDLRSSSMTSSSGQTMRELSPANDVDCIDIPNAGNTTPRLQHTHSGTGSYVEELLAKQRAQLSDAHRCERQRWESEREREREQHRREKSAAMGALQSCVDTLQAHIATLQGQSPVLSVRGDGRAAECNGPTFEGSRRASG